MLRKYPDSYTAIGFVASADAFLKNWDDWKRMLDAQLTKHPEDNVVLRMKTGMLERSGDWAGARAVRQELADKGKATASDYNSYGWTGLFDGKVDEDVIKAARQGTMLANNASFPELRVLSAVHLSGFGGYILGSTVLGTINGALGLGPSFGAFTGLSSLISVVIGPVGWIVLGLRPMHAFLLRGRFWKTWLAWWREMPTSLTLTDAI